MFIEILLACLIGVTFGIITGLTPGIHINLVATVIISLMPLAGLNPLFAVVMIISIAITHIFLDFIPSTFLGVPTADNSLSLLPSQELLLQGKSYESIFLSVVGCLLGIILIVIFTPLLVLITKPIYTSITNFIPYILIFSLLLLLFKEKNMIWAAIIIFLSGILGIISFKLSVNEILFPMFSGLFGVSSLIMSISHDTMLPEQFISKVELNKFKTIKIAIKGFFASLLVGFLPGMGSAQASMIATSFSKNNERKDYIILVSSINSIVLVMAMIALFTINKARNGAIALISEMFGDISAYHFILFISLALFVSGIAAIITIKISKIFMRVIKKINYKKLSYLIIFLIAILVLNISGLIGFLVLIVASTIGLMPILKKVSRNSLMASLIVPVILYYLA